MTFPPLRLVSLLLVTTATLPAGDSVKPVDAKTPKQAVNVQQPEESSWSIDAGAQWRQIGKLNWQTGSLATRSSLPWLAGRGAHGNTSGSNPSGIGDHTYDNGFVMQDDGTPFDGNTAFYGYNSDSQVQGNNLTYNSANGGGTTSKSSYGASSTLRQPGWSDDLSGAGWFIKMESPALLKLGPVSATLELGYSFTQDDTGHQSLGVFRASQSMRSTTRAVSVQDVYDVSGLTLPQAPFAGTLGGFAYPIIPDAPRSRTTGLGRATNNGGSAVFSSDVQERFKLNLHTISLGPDFNAQLGRVRFGFGLGFGLNIADWDASYEERLSARVNGGPGRTLKSYRESASGTEALAGLYLQSSIEVSLTKHIGLYGSGRYDWAQSFSSGVGPSKFTVDVSGWTLGGGVSYRF